MRKGQRRRYILTPAMDLTFILSAAIFTLLAIVIATSLLNGSSSSDQYAKAQRYFGHRGDGSGLDQTGPKQNGYVPDKKMKKKAEDDWCEISGSSHDHWDVVKSVLSVSRLQTLGEKSGCLFVLYLISLNLFTDSPSHTVYVSSQWMKHSDPSSKSCFGQLWWNNDILISPI